mgnify:CR=1 FL=1
MSGKKQESERKLRILVLLRGYFGNSVNIYRGFVIDFPPFILSFTNLLQWPFSGSKLFNIMLALGTWSPI